jgi:CheY-like chemotaxis protein
MSILLVADHDAVDQRIIKLSLVKAPVFKHVLYFSEGMQVINYLQLNKNDISNLPDVILLSLNLPDSNSWDVLDEINALYPRLSKKLVVYLTSAYITRDERDTALTYSFVKEIVYKPILKDKLTAIAEEVKNNRVF